MHQSLVFVITTPPSPQSSFAWSLLFIYPLSTTNTFISPTQRAVFKINFSVKTISYKHAWGVLENQLQITEGNSNLNNPSSLFFHSTFLSWAAVPSKTEFFPRLLQSILTLGGSKPMHMRMQQSWVAPERDTSLFHFLLCILSLSSNIFSDARFLTSHLEIHTYKEISHPPERRGVNVRWLHKNSKGL